MKKRESLFTIDYCRKLMEAYRDEMNNRRFQWRESEDRGPGREEAATGVTKANFSLVAGTELLNEQLQAIKPQIHIFGEFHSITKSSSMIIFPRS